MQSIPNGHIFEEAPPLLLIFWQPIGLLACELLLYQSLRPHSHDLFSLLCNYHPVFVGVQDVYVQSKYYRISYPSLHGDPFGASPKTFGFALNCDKLAESGPFARSPCNSGLWLGRNWGGSGFSCHTFHMFGYRSRQAMIWWEYYPCNKA